MEFITEQGRIYANSSEGELLCEIVFPAENGIAEIEHTFVSPKLAGQGVAGKLVEQAMAQISSRGLKVYPSCSYAAKWLTKHPEFDAIKVEG